MLTSASATPGQRFDARFGVRDRVGGVPRGDGGLVRTLTPRPGSSRDASSYKGERLRLTVDRTVCRRSEPGTRGSAPLTQRTPRPATGGVAP